MSVSGVNGRDRQAPSWPRPKRPTAILVCYSCVPGEGSESGVGWMWAKAASEVADVILITFRSEWSHRIEDAIKEEDLRITPCWVNVPRWVDGIAQGKVLGTVKYCYWQFLAGRAISRLESEQRIDVVHHVSWASDSLPSALLGSRAPVRIWGPVGGVTGTHRGLYRFIPLGGVVAERARDLANGTIRATFGRWVARHATLVVALNRDVEAHWRRGPTPVTIESNTALGAHDLPSSDPSVLSPKAGTRRVALFVGRLVRVKGLFLAVESLVHAPDWTLIVMGEGPDRSRAEAVAARIGVADRIEFRGWVPRAEVLSAFSVADALLFSSLHDSSPWAVGEASMMGCPVVCLDSAGGPALQAGRNGRVVPTVPARTLPQRIGAALSQLDGRGEPDDHLRFDRIPDVLRQWYQPWEQDVPMVRGGADDRGAAPGLRTRWSPRVVGTSRYQR